MLIRHVVKGKLEPAHDALASLLQHIPYPLPHVGNVSPLWPSAGYMGDHVRASVASVPHRDDIERIAREDEEQRQRGAAEVARLKAESAGYLGMSGAIFVGEGRTFYPGPEPG